ncbi:carbohydrate sulfotransferase 3-like, partial [Stylophora pistillata]|uniref:carbohydrate sulfotransferase 3-like n=1 Tax=Stylophora pistillata TaxID=50429 RepID=UPI000C04E2A9
LIGAIFIYMILQTNRLVSQKSKIFEDQPIVLDQQQVDEGVPMTQMASAIPPTTKPDTRRRSLVIFGDDRSGTTLLTQMFSQDLDIFTVYEPLWITKKWSQTEPDKNLLKDVTEVIGALMTCNFVDNPTAIKFLSHSSKNWAPGLFMNPFKSKPICNDPEACPNPGTIPDVVQKACLHNYKHSVIKVAIVRVPERKLSNIFQRIIEDNPDTVIKFLHVVRDPRGSINSRINLGWIPDVDKAKNFAYWPRSTCEGILQNVKFGASLQGNFKDRYMLLLYKDIASSPLVTAMKIYKFAGFEISESMIRWLKQATNPSKETLEQEGKHAFSSFRNSTANVERWRHESPDRRVRIIEEECSELMDLLHLEKLP